MRLHATKRETFPKRFLESRHIRFENVFQSLHIFVYKTFLENVLQTFCQNVRQNVFKTFSWVYTYSFTERFDDNFLGVICLNVFNTIWKGFDQTIFETFSIRIDDVRSRRFGKTFCKRFPESTHIRL